MKTPLRKKVAEVLKRVKGVSVAGVISFEDKTSLSDVLTALNEVGAAVAFGGVQYLRYYGTRGGKDVLTMIAYAYDNLENVKFVLSG